MIRTVGEIVEAVQRQEDVGNDELRLALLCLYYDGTMAARSDYERQSEVALRLPSPPQEMTGGGCPLILGHRDRTVTG